jgi:diaminopimelate epimerase
MPPGNFGGGRAQSRRFSFTKMQGCGNDFVIVDCTREPLETSDLAATARRLCDRRFGIGSDGLVLVEPPLDSGAALRMRMLNPDGTEAACGNALRCVARYARTRGVAPCDDFAIDSLGGRVGVRVMGERVEVDMGQPILAPAAIPIRWEREPALDVPVSLDGETWRLTAVSMGNPHAIFFVDAISDEHVRGLGPQMERHPLFPERTNVEFVEVLSEREVRLRVWERGAGETLACGTGACATVVACVLHGRTEHAVTVHLPGGDLAIEWRENSNHVLMTGPGEFVFSGEAPI